MLFPDLLVEIETGLGLHEVQMTFRVDTQFFKNFITQVENAIAILVFDQDGLHVA
jgi:hypothetical protein